MYKCQDCGSTKFKARVLHEGYVENALVNKDGEIIKYLEPSKQNSFVEEPSVCYVCGSNNIVKEGE